MAVIRWILSDHLGNSYTFPRNPSGMTSPTLARNITTSGSTSGAITATEGSPAAKQWSFTGRTVDRAHYDALMTWKARPYRWKLTDHLGRQFTVVPVDCEWVWRRNAKNYWDGDYTFTVLTLAETAPTVSDIWS